MLKIEKVLNELSPYVVVVGSYGRGNATDSSDLDMYIKRRSDEELDTDYYGDLEEHYIDKVIKIFEENGLDWGSSVIGQVYTDDLEISLEASYLFKIPNSVKLEKIELFGVQLDSAVDDKYLNPDNKVLW